MFLLLAPFHFFDGLIILHGKLQVKLSLWSFSVMKAFLSAYCSIPLSRSKCLDNSLASSSMSRLVVLQHLRYVFVMLFDSNLLCASFDSSYTFLVLSAKTNTFVEDRMSRKSLSSLVRNLLLTGLHSMFRTISYRSFSN